MDTEKKVNYLCINSSTEFRIMDVMYQAILNNNFYVTLHDSEENTCGNVFNIFFNKIIPIKSNQDLYAKNIGLLDRYLSNNKIQDITPSMNFLLNNNFHNEMCLDKKTVENIGKILFFGFNKIKKKHRTYQITTQADLLSKIEQIKFEDIDLLQEYTVENYNEKDNNSNKYEYRTKKHISSSGKECCKESNILPNEIILLINKFQYIKSLSLKIDELYSDVVSKDNLDIIFYLIILNNVNWIVPNILEVNFDLTCSRISNSLIDILNLKLNQELQNIDLKLINKKTIYDYNQVQCSTLYNYEMMTKQRKTNIKIRKINLNNKTILKRFNTLKKERIEKNLPKSQKKKIKKAKTQNVDDEIEESLEFGIGSPDILGGCENFDEEENKINKEIIDELYNKFIDKHTKEFDMIIITASFIMIWDKLCVLNIKCPDIFSTEIRESFAHKKIYASNDMNFLNLFTEIKMLNNLNIEFNCLDYRNFSKILGMVSYNINLSVLRLIFFSNNIFYSAGGIYKLLNDLNESSINQINKILNKKGNIEDLENYSYEEILINYYLLEHFQKNLEILFSLLSHHRKTLSEFVIVLNTPFILVNNDSYNISILKFIINILIFLAFDKHNIKVIKILSPQLKLDSRKYPLISNVFNNITEKQIEKNLKQINTLYLQFTLIKIPNIVNLITENLSTINIGNFDLPTFKSFVDKYISENFRTKSKLFNLKITLQNSLVNYDKDLKENIINLMKYNPKLLHDLDLITNIKMNYDDLKEIIFIIKNNYINKYFFIFNESSEEAINKIKNDDLKDMLCLSKIIEIKRNLLANVLMKKIKVITGKVKIYKEPKKKKKYRKKRKVKEEQKDNKEEEKKSEIKEEDKNEEKENKNEEIEDKSEEKEDKNEKKIITEDEKNEEQEEIKDEEKENKNEGNKEDTNKKEQKNEDEEKEVKEKLKNDEEKDENKKEEDNENDKEKEKKKEKEEEEEEEEEEEKEEEKKVEEEEKEDEGVVLEKNKQFRKIIYAKLVRYIWDKKDILIDVNK